MKPKKAKYWGSPLKIILILGLWCLFAIFIAGCISSEHSDTPAHELTMPPTPGEEILPVNTTGHTGYLNRTMSGERGPSLGGMNMTQGGPDQLPGSKAGAPDGQFRNTGEMNGSFPAPGEMPGGMKPPAPPAS